MISVGDVGRTSVVIVEVDGANDITVVVLCVLCVLCVFSVVGLSVVVGASVIETGVVADVVVGGVGVEVDVTIASVVTNGVSGVYLVVDVVVLSESANLPE